MNRRLLCLLGGLVWAGTLQGTGCRERPPVPAPPNRPRAMKAVEFTDVSGALGIDYRWSTGGKHPLNILELMSAGAGFADYDDDGWLDALLVGSDRCTLFRNEAGARFIDVSAGSGLDRLRGRWHGCAVADCDGDGRRDFFLTGYRQYALLRNLGGPANAPRFARVAIPALDSHTWGTSASFFDADGDGYLDLCVGKYVRFGPGSPEFMVLQGVPLSLAPDAYEAEKPQLLLNRQGRSFRDVTRRSGIAATRGKCLGAAVGDFNDDGRDDLYLANDAMPGDLFLNQSSRGAEPRFRNIGDESGTSVSVAGKRQAGMGVAWGDYDNDGRLDLIVTTFTQEPKSLYHNDGGYPPSGHWFFTERSFAAGISQSTLPWVGFGVRFVDLNNDGWLDLPMVNGHVQDLVRKVDPANDYPQPLFLFLNRRDGTFEDAAARAGRAFNRRIVGRALATGDYDNDGDQDLLAADLEGAPLLLRNDSGSLDGHWVTLSLVGKAPNRDALGARVELVAGGLKQVREARTDGSYLSASDPRVHFGLGKADRITRLVIRWPGGGWQSVPPPPIDRIVTLEAP